MRFACCKTTTTIRVDAAVNHYPLEAPLVLTQDPCTLAAQVQAIEEIFEKKYGAPPTELEGRLDCAGPGPPAESCG